MKKLISSALAAAILASCISCSEKKKSEKPVDAASAVTQTMYKEERMDFPEKYRSFQDMSYVEGKGMRLLCTDTEGSLMFVDYDGDMQASAAKKLFSAENTFLTRAAIEADGSISLLIGYIFSEDDVTDRDYLKNADYSFEIRRFSPDGEQTELVELSDFGEQFNGGEDFVNSFFRYGDGWIVITNKSRLLIGKSGSITEISDYEGGVSCCVADRDGKYIFADDTQFGYMDGKTLKEPQEMTEYGRFLRLSKGAFTGAGSFGVFFMLNDGVFGLSPDGSVVKVVDFKTSRIMLNEIYCAAYAGEGKFALIGADDGGFYMSVLTVRPDDYVENRERIYSTGKNGMQSEMISHL